MAIAAIAGIVALFATPREEEPQIAVPIADVFVDAPGLSAAQVERHVATRVEKLLAQIAATRAKLKQELHHALTATAGTAE